jgi:hypothetical protein
MALRCQGSRFRAILQRVGMLVVLELGRLCWDDIMVGVLLCIFGSVMIHPLITYTSVSLFSISQFSLGTDLQIRY